MCAIIAFNGGMRKDFSEANAGPGVSRNVIGKEVAKQRIRTRPLAGFCGHAGYDSNRFRTTRALYIDCDRRDDTMKSSSCPVCVAPLMLWKECDNSIHVRCSTCADYAVRKDFLPSLHDLSPTQKKQLSQILKDCAAMGHPVHIGDNVAPRWLLSFPLSSRNASIFFAMLDRNRFERCW